MLSWTKDATNLPSRGEDVGPCRRRPAAGIGALVRQEVPLPRVDGFVELVSVWLSTLVEMDTWAMAWPMPACGRMAVPIRKPSVA